MRVGLLALLLALNLCNLPPETRTQPVPAPPPGETGSSGEKSSLAAALPGRLLFLSSSAVTVLEGGEAQSVPIPPRLTNAALSPDGQRLAGLQGNTLVLVDLTTGKTVPVTDTAVREAPVWAPDGSRVAVFAAGGEGTRLLLFDVSGAKQAEVQVPVSSGRPATVWAPDGVRLAVSAGPPSAAESTIWLADAAAGTATLFREKASGPVWTPDAQALIYEDRGGAEARIVRAHLATGTEETLLSEELLGDAVPSMRPLNAVNELEKGWMGWSPDGRALGLIVKSAGPDPRFLIIGIQPDGPMIDARVLPVYPDHPRNVGQYPPRPCSVGDFRWAPRGDRAAAVLASAGCDGTLSLMRAKGLSVERDVTVPDGSRVRFSPDGEWVAVSASSGAAEVIAVSNDERIPLSVTGELLDWLP